MAHGWIHISGQPCAMYIFLYIDVHSNIFIECFSIIAKRIFFNNSKKISFTSWVGAAFNSQCKCTWLGGYIWGQLPLSHSLHKFPAGCYFRQIYFWQCKQLTSYPQCLTHNSNKYGLEIRLFTFFLSYK